MTAAPRHPQGVSLLECLIVMSMSSLMLGLAITLLHTLFESQRSGSLALERGLREPQIAALFRRDVRAAQRVQVDPNEDGTRLELIQDEDHRVVYSMKSGQLLRTDIVGNEPKRLESFALPDVSCGFEINTTETTPAVTHVVMKLIRDKDLKGKPSRELQIVGWLGRDHRFDDIQEPTP